MVYVSRLTCYLLEIWFSICSRRLICEYLVILFLFALKPAAELMKCIQWIIHWFSDCDEVFCSTVYSELYEIQQYHGMMVRWKCVEFQVDYVRLIGNYVRLIGDDVLFIHKKCLFFNSLKFRRVFISVQSFPSIGYKMWPLKWHYISIWTSTFDWYILVISVNKLCVFIWIFLKIFQISNEFNFKDFFKLNFESLFFSFFCLSFFCPM